MPTKQLDTTAPGHSRPIHIADDWSEYSTRAVAYGAQMPYGQGLSGEVSVATDTPTTCFIALEWEIEGQTHRETIDGFPVAQLEALRLLFTALARNAKRDGPS